MLETTFWFSFRHRFISEILDKYNLSSCSWGFFFFTFSCLFFFWHPPPQGFDSRHFFFIVFRQIKIGQCQLKKMFDSRISFFCFLLCLIFFSNQRKTTHYFSSPIWNIIQTNKCLFHWRHCHNLNENDRQYDATRHFSFLYILKKLVQKKLL